MFDTPRPPFAPIPGTTPAPRGLFVDRWGTLLVTPERGWAETRDEVEFQPGALDALFQAVRGGWHVYLVGNEDAVATGALRAEVWEELEEHVRAELSAHGVVVQRHYTCTTRPDGVEGQVADSVYQLPNTGAFYHAAHEDGITLGRSWVVGDSTLELVAGWRAGLRTAAVRTGQALSDGVFAVDPELVGEDLGAIVRVLLGHAALSA